jgi:antitoxin Phd
MVKMTSVQAQNRFGELIDTAQREPVAITRHGRTAAFVVSPRDMEEILDARKRRSKALASFLEWREKTRSMVKPAAAKLTDEEVNRLVHELR